MLRKFNSIAAVLIICAGLAAYWNSFKGPFVLDDTTSITANPSIRHLWPLKDVLSFEPKINVTVQGRPILNLSLAINYALSGYNVWSYHALNLCIHLLCAICIFGIIRRTLFKKNNPIYSEPVSSVLALASALIWVVHPLNTEAVTYIIQRAESLTACFLFLSLYCSIRYFENEKYYKQWSLGAIVFCLLGMGTKEVMVTAPVLIFIYDKCFWSKSFKDALRNHFWHYAFLALSWLLLVYLLIQSGGNRGGSIGFGVRTSPFSYLYTQGEAIYRYLRLSYWPHPLVFEYGAFTIKDVRELTPWLLILPLIGLAIWQFFKKPHIGFLGAWFFIILSPTSLVPGTSQMIVEHRMYMPMLAIITLSTIGLYSLAIKHPRFTLERFLVGIFILAFILGITTYQHNKSYSSALQLWSDTLNEKPNNPLAHFMIAEEYLAKGNLNEAGEHYYKSVTLSPSFVVGHERFGEYLVKIGNFLDAEKEFKNALLLKPNFMDANMNLGILLTRINKANEALDYILKATTLEPDNAEAQYNLANVLVMLGRHTEAHEHYKQAVRLKKDCSQAYYNWANSLNTIGQFLAAIDRYNQAIALKPDYYLAEYNEGNAYASLHLLKQASEHYINALKIKPEFAFAELNLGSALFELGELKQAEAHYRKALLLDPSLDEAKENLRRISTIEGH
jgi:tetratricopeptide (TPR) repeat protein